jgi:signal transduction histidine kinase/DNA-binding response OmpR family regulator
MSDAEKTKILIVDDLPEKLLVYRVILEELGQELVAARSGAEALKQVLLHDFAVILLDVNMPDMDGFETAALIRRRKRSAHTPIIFVTAFADEVRAAEGYARGAVDYILAPVVPEVLRAKVQVFVDLFRMTAQVRRQAEEQIALAEERSRRTIAEEANRRLSYLARAGAVLGHSLDYEVTARDIARICVPALADLALLAQRDDSGQWRMIEAACEGANVTVVQAGGLDPLPPWCADQVERAVEAGEPQLMPAGLSAGDDLPTHGIVLPLQARGRTFAALALTRGPSERSFAPADITMAEALVSRAAIALDNALLYREVEQADQQKNEFLSMLAHELRNPLAPIRNAVAVLRMQQHENTETSWAQDVIDRQVSHLVRLVDDLLDISRITRGKIRLELECQDVAAIVTAAVETSRPLIDAGGHHLSVELPEEPLWVNADEARLSQVLANLLNNAAKYTPSGGSIALRVQREGSDAVFSVRDSGIGIPPEMLPRVFDLFTQVEHSLDRSQGGLGIGLTLVQRLVEMHGGSVRATSAGTGHGSEFTVRLPAVAGLSHHAAGNNGSAAACGASQLRILVVDDNADAADSLAMLLRFSGHHVRIAYDGPGGVEAARSFRPQAVVLDLGLPGIDCYEVARRLRGDPDTSDVLLLALSGYGREEDHRRTTDAGFDHHFVKPLDFAALANLLSSRGVGSADLPLRNA